MGGIDFVAIALSESPTIEDFGQAVGMTEQEVENLKVILVSVEQGDIGILHSLGIMVAVFIKFHKKTFLDSINLYI